MDSFGGRRPGTGHTKRVAPFIAGFGTDTPRFLGSAGSLSNVTRCCRCEKKQKMSAALVPDRRGGVTQFAFGIVGGIPFTTLPGGNPNQTITLTHPTMARTSTYLNFARSTEEAFVFYKTVFGTEFSRPIIRFNGVPCQPGQPPMAEADQQLVMHVALPILGGHVLMGTDAPETMGFSLKPGNNIFINLEPDTRTETDRLFKALSAGGKVETTLQEMFWGDYFGTAVDRFGVQWMFNCTAKN